MIQICKQCGTSFDSKRKKSFCSRSCDMKYRWKNDEYKEKMSNMSKELWKNDDFRKNITENLTKMNNERWLDIEYHEYISNKLKESWNNPEVRKKITDGINDKKSKELRSASSKRMWKNKDIRESIIAKNKERWKDQEFIEKMSNIGKERWTDFEYREKMTVIRKEVWKNEEYRTLRISQIRKFVCTDEYRKLASDNGKLLWKDPDYAIKMFNCFKYKEYTLPSGKVVKLQGYEPQVLTELLKMYTEEDIIIGVKEINKEIGRISYVFENKEHTYYPDFYIKSENKIIEVKSQWTFDKWKEKNIAKEQACLQQGFNFEFKIL